MNIGKLFMFGFEGVRPSRGIIDLIQKHGLGGIILFHRNIKDIEQLKGLTAELQDAAGGGLLIGIDQEGGRVARLPTSFIDIPPMREFGKAYEKNLDARPVHALGRELGEKLKVLGINLDFAPVLDVLTNEANPVIGDRAFSARPDVVAKLGCELARGMREAGIIACGKHFPGHGDTAEDSHKTLPRLPHDIKRLESTELVPFKKAIEEGIPSLMSVHVVYEGIDPKRAATFSKKILKGILRTKLGFKGVLFSDDMEMDAVTENFGADEAAVKAFKAGCDIILICHTEAKQRAAMDAVKKAVEKGTILATRISEALARIGRLLQSGSRTL